MKLVCPSCGAVCSIEGWANDAAARQCVALLCDMPGAVHVLQYMGLFRPSSRGMSWTRTLTLIRELDVLIKAPHVQRDRMPARGNSADVWAQALARIGENPPRKLPLKSHGYLHAIAYDIANELDRAGEKSRIAAEQTGRFRQPEGEHGEPEKLDREEMRRIANESLRRRAKGTKVFGA